MDDDEVYKLCDECRHPVNQHTDLGCEHKYKNDRVCQCSVTDMDIELDELESKLSCLRAEKELTDRLIDNIRFELVTGHMKPDCPAAVCWRDCVERNHRYADAKGELLGELRLIEFSFKRAGIDFNLSKVLK